MIQLFQQRDFGDKINATFQYITQNFRSLSLSLLYIVGPVALVAGIASGIMQSNLFDLAKLSGDADSGSDPTAAFRMMQNVFSPAFGIAALFSLLAILVVSLATYAHMKVYGRKTAQRMETSQEPVPISVAEVWEEMQAHIGRALVVSVLSSIVTVVATFFFVLPGIYVGIVFSLAIAVVVFESTDFSQTWNRCFTLIRDKWWSTFGLLIVMGIISGLVGLVFTLPAGVISFLIGSKLLPDVGGFWVVVGNVLATVGGTLLRSIIYIALGFQYTNLVERQEGRGLLSAIDSIGTNPTQSRSSNEETY
jgi:MFS family permease